MRKILEQKYIDHFIGGGKSLTVKDAEAYLEILYEDIAAEFRDRRIKTLQRFIREQKRQQASADAEKHKQYEAAAVYRDLTEKWEAAGAYWRPLGPTAVKWYYGGTCFLTWFSGIQAVDLLVRAKKADEVFEELRKEAEA